MEPLWVLWTIYYKGRVRLEEEMRGARTDPIRARRMQTMVAASVALRRGRRDAGESSLIVEAPVPLELQ